MTAPYRSPPPLARLAPRTPWHRLAWAWCRGVFGKLEAQRWQRRRDEHGNIRPTQYEIDLLMPPWLTSDRKWIAPPPPKGPIPRPRNVPE